MITKKRFLQSLQYSWWIYLVILLVPIVVWTSVFSVMLQPKKNQKIEIAFFNHDDFDVLNFNNHLYDYFASEGDLSSSRNLFDGLKSVTMETIASNQSSFYTLLGTRNAVCDILIFAEDTLRNTTQNDDSTNWVYPAGYFNPIPVDVFQRIWSERGHQNFDQIKFYTIDGKAYGIYLNDDINDNTFEHYYSGTTRTVAFFTKDSVNVASINGKGKSTDGGAIDVIAYLLEDYNG